MSLDINCLPITDGLNSIDCSPIAIGDFKQVGVLFPRSNIDFNSVIYDGCKVKFKLKAPGGGLKVYDRSMTPFDGTTTTEEVNRFKIYTDLVVFPLFKRNPESAEILNALSNTNERWVFIAENEKVNASGDNRFVIKGFTAGITLKTDVQDRTNYAAWKIELEQKNSTFPELYLFDTDDATTISFVDNMVSYEWITGLTIDNRGAIKLTVDSDKNCYIVAPDKSVITSTNGAINTTWTGYAGNVKLIIPKNTSKFNIENGSYKGVLKTNTMASVTCDNCNLLTSVSKTNGTSFVYFALCPSVTSFYAPLTTIVYGDHCALTAKAIGDFLFEAAQNNPTAAGIANFSGGTNAGTVAVSQYMSNDPTDNGNWLSDFIQNNLPNWTITLNP
jgi:hypothetical protein